MTRCSVCGADIPPGDEWPGDDGGALCQECWEAHCSRLWWEIMAGGANDDQAEG